ncbi:MAG: carbon monoxide dehydrogenase subunit G [Alphaproteobacteria bacterium]|nr:carbon monoxide dehydrogenase subunit G [Alphaproteobacteria bacterium]
MNLAGEHLIRSPKLAVWNAINDPEVLREAIPGCQELHKKSETEFDAVVQVKVGPLKANFKGSVRLDDIEKPDRCVIVGEGQGGVAGFAKGNAQVELIESQGATLIRYNVHAAIGGKLAQIGSRVVQGVATRLTLQFFENLVARIEPADARERAEGAA